MSLEVLVRKVLFVWRSDGWRGLASRARAAFEQLRSGGFAATLSRLSRPRDPLAEYGFALTPAAASPPIGFAPAPDSIVWLIPDFGVGSGGHLNIFRFIAMLEQHGFRNTIAIVGRHRHRDPHAARELIARHFAALKADVRLGLEGLPDAGFGFATSWQTAYYLNGLSRVATKCYFVQDFEPYFYPHGSVYALAEQTYRLGYFGITQGAWLAQKLRAEFGMHCEALSFSYDKQLYRTLPRSDPLQPRVFCYCRPPTERRGFELSMLALDLVGRQMPGVEFVFAGWDLAGHRFPHRHRSLGVLGLAELPAVYSSCDVALVLSFTNLSLLPLELMACGAVVVSNRGPNAEWLLDAANSVLADATPGAIATAIVTLLREPELRRQIAARAAGFAASTSWDLQGRKLASVLRATLAERA